MTLSPRSQLNNHNRLFMAARLVRAQSAYKFKGFVELFAPGG